MDKITIQWLGHACFKISAGDYSVVLDPYEDDRVPGYGRVRTEANEVMCSHQHKDHNNLFAVTLKNGYGSPFEVFEAECPHDDKNGELRGMNIIRGFELGDLSVIHFGDIGCWPDDELLEELGEPDAVMIPVGGFYTIDAATASKLADALKAKVVIPMHYRTEELGYNEIGTLDEFTALRDDVVMYEGDTIEITADTPKQTAVLKYGRA